MSVAVAVRSVAVAALLARTLSFAAEQAPDQASELTMTLQGAIEGALEKNENIFIQRESLSSAQAAITGARGAYDPLLEVDAGWRQESLPVNSAFSGAPTGELAATHEAVDAGTSVRQLLSSGGELSLRAAAVRSTTDSVFTFLTPAYDTVIGFEARQPLLQGLPIDPYRLTIRVAEAGRDQASAELEVQVADTVADVERAYWTLVALREAVGVREDSIRLAEEQLEETRARIDSGIAPDTEIAQPLAELERRRGDLLATREAVARAQNALKLLILSDSDVEAWGRPIVPVESVEVEGVDVDVAAAIEQALASRPELDAAVAFEERRRVERQFTEDVVRPSLDLVVAYDLYGLAGSLNPAGAPPGLPPTVPPQLEGGLGSSFDTLADGDFDDMRAGLVFTIPLGNRTARAAAAVAQNAERQAAAELAQTRKAVRAEVLDAAAALDTTYQRVGAARAAVDASQVQLDAEQERFDAGLSTNFLVLTRQNDLESSRIDEIRARTDYRTARTAMARATGSLLEERGITLLDAAGGQGAETPGTGSTGGTVR
jgi:outer membrane protein TolC